MYSAFFAPALALGSILGILAMLEWGRYLGKRALAADGEAARVGVTVIEGAVYALTDAYNGEILRLSAAK